MFPQHHYTPMSLPNLTTWYLHNCWFGSSITAKCPPHLNIYCNISKVHHYQYLKVFLKKKIFWSNREVNFWNIYQTIGDMSRFLQEESIESGEHGEVCDRRAAWSKFIRYLYMFCQPMYIPKSISNISPFKRMVWNTRKAPIWTPPPYCWSAVCWKTTGP